MKSKFKSKSLFLSSIIFVIFLTGCSVAEYFVYKPEIQQGNYLSQEEIAKIKLGMDKTQVSYLLGSPMLTSIFGDDVWYYIFYRENENRTTEKSRLILTFNDEGRLIDAKE